MTSVENREIKAFVRRLDCRKNDRGPMYRK